MAAASYQLFGLRVRSEIPLAAPEVPGDRWDVEVFRDEPRPTPDHAPAGRRLAGLEVRGRSLHTAVEDDAGYLLRFHGVGDVRITPDLSTVVVAVDPEGEAGMVPILLAGTVVAFLLTLGGRPVLHGSAVEVGGQALAFVGHSGAGKSTLAAEACVAGARLVADDVLALHVAGDQVFCLRGGSSLRLRPAATELAGRFAVRSATHDRRTAVGVAPSADAPALAAVVVPVVDGGAAEPRLERLAPREAFRALTRFHRVAGLVDPAAVERHFHTCVDLSQRVPVLELLVPLGRSRQGAALAVSSVLEPSSTR